MPWDDLRHTVLEDDRLLMRPVEPGDREQYGAIAFDDDIWRYFVFRVRTGEDLDRMIADALDDAAAGRRVAFSIIDKRTGRIVGSMSYGSLAEKEARLEIGFSWLGRDARGTGINTHAKFLMLRHAFEALGCERVEFKTDVLNLRARQGLRNIGATEEGVLRSFNYMPDNRRRDAVYYSILKREWPEVSALLTSRMARPESDRAS